MSETLSLATLSLSEKDTSLVYRTARMVLKLPKNVEFRGIAILAVCLVYTLLLFWLAALIHAACIVFNWTKYTFKGSPVVEMSVHVDSSTTTTVQPVLLGQPIYSCTTACSSRCSSATTSPCSSRAASPATSPLAVRKKTETSAFSRSSTWVLSPVSRKKTMRKL